MNGQRALWASTSTATRGGVATYVRAIQGVPLWRDWNIRHISTHRDGGPAAKAMAFARGSVEFVVALVTFRPDVVHLHSSAGASFARKAILLWLSWVARVPVVLHIHGSDFQLFYDDSPRAVQWVIRGTLDHAGAVVALGDDWSRRLQSIAPHARISVIPNAIQSADRIVQPVPGGPVHVVFLGRIGDRKGTFRLLDAWADMLEHSDSDRECRLTIAGDGEVERARRRVAELRISDSVAVREWLSSTEVAALLDCAHVLALPSRNEGQPMAVLEAMARGLCVVASDAGGIPEMIDGGCGVVTSADDVAAISAALRLVVHDDETRARLGAAAFERFHERFDVDVVSRRIDALYREVLR
ncbi:glycosyltransferase family 4 protein [Rhodococcus sp. NPDC059234]|uniref:glycosyltransferase family 4 protein n=1 Tax=Rhodococcus sp. NPDC059234 TaxID=3346781 RepID=UPI00366C4565